jgi:hypothetical protein
MDEMSMTACGQIELIGIKRRDPRCAWRVINDHDKGFRYPA